MAKTCNFSKQEHLDFQDIRPTRKCIIGQCKLANKNTWLIKTCDWSIQKLDASR